MSPTYRNIESIGGARKRPGNRDFSAANVSSPSVRWDIDPLINLDHFHMRAPTFAPHPHAGFSAVTYLFEDSEGTFINRDSRGDEIVAQPGSIIWTVAGKGVMHEEYPAVRGQLAHGLQIFVNLPATDKLQAPRLLFTDGPEVALHEQPGVRVRVLTGASHGVHSRFEAPNGVTLLDIQLAPGAALDEELPSDVQALVYVIKGSALVGSERRALRALDAASFAQGDGAIAVRAGDEGVQVVLVAGRPLREPMASYGPFVMNTEQQIRQAIARYRAGEMGSLESKAMP